MGGLLGACVAHACIYIGPPITPTPAEITLGPKRGGDEAARARRARATGKLIKGLALIDAGPPACRVDFGSPAGLGL